MHCPKCGQQQISDETRYCSRCGLPLGAIAKIVANDGLNPERQIPFAGIDSPKRRGVKKGAFLFLLSLFIVPILSILAIATNSKPILPAIAAIVCVCGGLLRIIYALLFESSFPGGTTLEDNLVADSKESLNRKQQAPELSASHSEPAAVYAAPGIGGWKDTNELDRPSSVTDSTTRLLSRTADDQ